MRFYDGAKIDTLAENLKVDPESIRVWSDNSLTIRNTNEQDEYFVTKGKRKYSTFLTRKNGYNIYINTFS